MRDNQRDTALFPARFANQTPFGNATFLAINALPNEPSRHSTMKHTIARTEVWQTLFTPFPHSAVQPDCSEGNARPNACTQYQELPPERRTAGRGLPP